MSKPENHNIDANFETKIALVNMGQGNLKKLENHDYLHSISWHQHLSHTKLPNYTKKTILAETKTE